MGEQEQQSVGVVSTLAGLRSAVNAIIEPITRDGTIPAFSDRVRTKFRLP